MTETGPPVPRYAPGAAPGDNAIGSFVIGSSPIGTIPAFDWWQTVISEYANSPILTGLLESMFDAVDLTALFDEMYDKIQNIETAEGYGLDVIGRIVDISRIITIPDDVIYLSFEESGDDGVFGVGTFYAGASTTTNFILADPAYRTLILAKALANICDGSSKAINALLRALFPGRGNAYVVDNLNMTMVYTFNFALTPVELSIVQNSGVLPRPAGVSVTVIAPP